MVVAAHRPFLTELSFERADFHSQTGDFFFVLLQSACGLRFVESQFVNFLLRATSNRDFGFVPLKFIVKNSDLLSELRNLYGAIGFLSSQFIEFNFISLRRPLVGHLRLVSSNLGLQLSDSVVLHFDFFLPLGGIDVPFVLRGRQFLYLSSVAFKLHA